jgi:FkbM family methyltransferase
VSLDAALSRFTRHVPRFRGWHRLLEPLRRHYVRVYEGRDDRWTEIADFEGDLRMRLDRSAYMGSVIYWRGIHAYAEAGIIRRFLPEDGVFVDVGANQGELTLVAARRARRGRVVSFEPVPQWHDRLAENVALNRFANVTLVRAGVSDHEGTAEMFTSHDTKAQASFNEGLSSFQRSGYRDTSVGTFPLVTLDAWASRETLARLDLLKIDTEGSERAVLEGASATLERFHPMLLLELNQETFGAAGYTGETLAGWLRERGYALFLVDPFARVRPLEGRPLDPHGTLFARHVSGA